MYFLISFPRVFSLQNIGVLGSETLGRLKPIFILYRYKCIVTVLNPVVAWIFLQYFALKILLGTKIIKIHICHLNTLGISENS